MKNKVYSTVFIGSVIALISAVGLGALTTLARISYNHGGRPFTFMALRFWFAVAAFSLVCLLAGKTWRVAPRTIPAVIMVGIGWFVGTLGYVWSVKYIPVSLAVLIFYTFPLVVAIFTPLTEKTRFSGLVLSGFLVCFAGLALALSATPEKIDPRGIALGLLGSAGAATTFLAGARAVRQLEPMMVALYSNMVGAVLVIALVVIDGGLVFPQAGPGLLALTIATVLYSLALLAQYYSLKFIAPDRSAIMFNLEPFVTLTAAAILLGERFNPIQWAGVLLVIMGIVIVNKIPSRKPQTVD